MFCKRCGGEMNDKAVICVKCGVPVENAQIMQPPKAKVIEADAGNAKSTFQKVLSIGNLVCAGLFAILFIVVFILEAVYEFRLVGTQSVTKVLLTYKALLAFILYGVMAVINVIIALTPVMAGKKIGIINITSLAIVITIIFAALLTTNIFAIMEAV